MLVLIPANAPVVMLPEWLLQSRGKKETELQEFTQFDFLLQLRLTLSLAVLFIRYLKMLCPERQWRRI